MTADEHGAEGAEEAIEDLEAPADAQGDVAGGADATAQACGSPSMLCLPIGSCKATAGKCLNPESNDVIIWEK